jgi:catechol 2,3-dioxygenase-like lactoylglutathione lyase family enzyme
MNIIGPDALVFGVDDVAACAQYLTDYGLKPVGGGRFEALDGTAIVIAAVGDKSLPPSLGTASMLRKTIYGCADAAVVEAIAQELKKDREVKRLPDGSIESVDDLGFALGFQVSVRRPLRLPAETVNAPGAPPQRPANVLAVDENAVVQPRTLSHVVYFVPDSAKAEAFYVQRLGFVCTDRFVGVGPFLRPAGTPDHHTLFMIQTPPQMKGCEHFTFHLGGPGPAQVRLQLVLVLQQPARLPRGVRRRHGPARRRLDCPRSSDGRRRVPAVPVPAPRQVGAGRSASRCAARRRGPLRRRGSPDAPLPRL